jgi:hypothetical protein
MSTTSETIRLPLWRTLAEQMLSAEIHYGDRFTIEFFEEGLRAKRDTMEFGIGVSMVRQVLEQSGFSLTQRGQDGEGLLIRSAKENEAMMHAFDRGATKSFRRAVSLGSATDRTQLNADELRRHEARLEHISVKAVLLQRSGQVAKIIAAHKPKLLETKNT